LPVGPTSAVGPGRPASSARDERWRAGGPRWSPVGPAPDASRIDVVGGDARRRGWASLLVTFGTSVLAGGQRLTVFDLTGQDVGGGLLGVARARGLGARRVDLPGDSLDVSLLEGLTGPEIAESLAGALTDQRRERAFAEELLALVIAGLGGWPTFDRLARGIDVVRRVVPADPLPAGEVRALADRAGELREDEWTAGQMHRVGSRLRALDALLRVEGAPAAAVGHQPLWAAEQVSLVTTASGAGERKVLLDRLLVELTQRALRRRGHLDGTLVVAGADHLGAASLDALSQRARTSGVRLVLMVDHPRGELDEALGTGGAVCIMQMADHGDATAAADLVGRGHEPAVEPRQVVDLPETAFILVEGSGPGRRVELADSDPALCLRLDPAPLDLR
jgi:hypothetical protein